MRLLVTTAPLVTGHLGFPHEPHGEPVLGRTLAETDHGGTARVGKHLLDETAEFRMPRIARHAAEDDVELEQTQRFDPGLRQQHKPVPPAPQEPNTR